MTAQIFVLVQITFEKERESERQMRPSHSSNAFLKTSVFQSAGFTRSVYGFGCVRRSPWMLSRETNVELSACRNNGGASGSHGCRRSNLREQCQGGVQHHPRTALLLGGAQDRLVAG